MTGVVFENVALSFGGRPVLRDVSFRIQAGERTALAGPNGGGKTTLVKLLLGILPPDSGRIRFVNDGVDVPRPRIGYLPQRSSLAADAPVSGVDLVSLMLSPEAGFGRRPDVEHEALHALTRAGLGGEKAHQPVGRLSGGQRQRVLLAAALAGAPALLLLDEPDTALDTEGLKTLRRIVMEEVAAGKTVIYVTHDSAAMGGADWVYWVDGTVTAEEPWDRDHEAHS